MDRFRPRALFVRHFDKVVLAAFGGWVLSQASGVIAGEPAADPVALAEARAAVEAHMQTAQVDAPRSPGWSDDLRHRLAAPAEPSTPFPTWVFHRRPAYLYETEAGPPPVQPVHGALSTPVARSPRRGEVELRWERPALDRVVLEGYVLERDGGDGWTVCARPGAEETAWTDVDLPLRGGAVRYRVRSGVRLDDADPALKGREVEAFPAERVSEPVEVEVASRLRVVIHGVTLGDALKREPGVAQGELWRWDGSTWAKQWFQAAEGKVAGRGDHAALGVEVLRVWTEEEPAGGLTRTVEYAEVRYADGDTETIRAGR